MAGAAKNAAATAAVTAKCWDPIECPSFVKAGASCLSTCYVLYRQGPCGRDPLRLRIGKSGLRGGEKKKQSGVKFGVRTQPRRGEIRALAPAAGYFFSSGFFSRSPVRGLSV